MAFGHYNHKWTPAQKLAQSIRIKAFHAKRKAEELLRGNGSTALTATSVALGLAARRQPTDVRFDLLDPEFIEAMAKIMCVGAAKYGERNWQKPGLVGAHSGLNHAHKHLNEYAAGKPNDYGEQRLHLAQVAVNAMFEYYHAGKKEAVK